MFDSHRQHPVAALTKALQIIKDNFISLLVLLFVTSGGSRSMISLFGILSVFAVLLIGGVLSWLRFTYRVVDGELHIEQGVFVRKNIYLSRERIQSIDIKAGVIQRLFGLVELEVKTAGSSSKEAKISAITRERAEALKRELRLRNGEEQAAEEPAAALPEPDIYRLTMRDLVVAACTSGSFGIALSIIGTIFSQIDQVISQEEMVQYLEALVPSGISTYMVVYLVVLLVAVSWLLSFMGTLIKYYGFSLEVHEREMVIKQGLFERRQLTVPFNRIQAVRVREGVMRQPFGYASVIIESAGYGEEGQQNNSSTLFPLLPKDEVAGFLREVVPDYAGGKLERYPPPRALRRYLTRMVLAALLLLLPVEWLLDVGYYGFLLLVPALALGWLQYRAAGVGMLGETMMIRYRTLSKTTAIVNKKRIQAATLAQNPFQRRLELSTYRVKVASGSGGAEFKVRELEQQAGEACYRWVSPAGPERETGFEGLA